MSKKKREKSPMVSGLKLIWKKDKTFVFIQIALAFTSALLPLINIFIPAKIVGILVTTKSIPMLVMYSAVAILGNTILFLVKNLLTTLQSKHYRKIRLEELADLSTKVLKVEYPTLEDANFESEITKYKMKDFSPFTNLFWIINSVLTGVIGLVLSIVMIIPFFKVIFKTTGTGFLHSPWYGVTIVGAIIVVAFIVIISSLIMNRRVNEHLKEFASYNRMFNFFQERLNDYNSGKDIRIYNEQGLIYNSAMGSILDKGVHVYDKMISAMSKQSGLIAIVGALVGFGIYSIIGLKGLAGYLSVESVVLCVGGMMQVVAGITNIANVFGKVNLISPKIKDYNQIMSIKEEVTHEVSFDEKFKEINVEGLSFKYREDLPITLDNINFDIKRGDKIALVGQNGSGKSTFIKLLCGLYPPTEGSFKLDGVPIDGYNSLEWRKQFSVVFQDSAVFSLPISHNISGGEEYDGEKVEKCLDQVGMMDRVKKMSNGYDSYLYQHYNAEGVEISGGEAQKISMARALYKDAPIMILDEPTAALDPFAEQEIYRKFNELTMDKTVFYISHRLSSCYFCNKIVVFDNGKLVQYGTHSELLKDTNGKYYELWNAQAKYYVKN